jgi:hypothetical protein
MTAASIFIFRITLLMSDFKTALLAFFIVTLNPVIFRLNFQPTAQQIYLTASCILMYFLLKALFTDLPAETSAQAGKSSIHFIIAGVFGFIALATRPEALFVIAPLAIVAALSKKQGKWYFVIISLIFQVFWIILSYIKYGSFFRTLQAADQYTAPVDIQGLNLELRLKGFFLPYYFLVVGLTIILFYYFVKGIIYSFKTYPKSILITLLIMMLTPALINGAAGMKSTIYHTTIYIYLMFFISPIFCAIGLNNDIIKIKHKYLQIALATVIILSCIPLSYIKEFVPEKYNKLFPKVIQFIVTTDEPEETRKLIKFVDENINSYPALLFDSDENTSSIFYVPFRTKLAPPEKILISSYNVPADKEGLKLEIDKFMKKNTNGIIMIRKSPTVMNQIFSELINNKPYKRNDIILALETEKWNIYTYQRNNK